MRLGLSAYAPPAPTPRMPAGLVELMEGLSRDVLRHNPQDLYQFCADHMQKLLLIRAAHEGRTRTMTLEEKIARAQRIVRQRAENRRRRYDEPDRRTPGFSDEEVSVDSDTRVIPLGVSPRTVPENIHEVTNKTNESTGLLDKGGETRDPTSEFKNVEDDTDDTVKAEIHDLVDDVNKVEVQEINNDKVVYMENEQNLEVLGEEKNSKIIKENYPEPENMEELATTEVLAIKSEEPNSETSLVNEVLILDCDELPIENHIFESGENNNEAETYEVLVEEKTSEKMGTSSENLEIKKENLEKEEDKRIELENSELGNFEKEICMEKRSSKATAELKNTEVKTEKTIENKVNEQTNEDALPNVKHQDVADGNTEVESEEIEIAKLENSVEEKKGDSDVVNYEVMDAMPDNKIDDSDKTPGKSTEIKTEENAEAEDITEELKSADSVTNCDRGNPKEIKSDEGEKIEPNEHEFEIVTIEVKAPTPLPEVEINNEVVNQSITETENNIVESETAAHKENETILFVSNIEKNNEESNSNCNELKNENPLEIKEVIPNEIRNIKLEDENAKDKDEMLMMTSCSNEDETDSVSDATAKVKRSVDENNSAPLDTERMSYIMSIPQNDDIDINALAKSDSTNDVIIEETTESISETNTEADEREESSKNPPAMDLETAAVTIQKVFRTFLFKSRASTLDDVSNDEGSMDVAMPEDIILSDEGGHAPKQEDEFANIKDRRTLGITRMDTVLQTVNEEKSLSLSTDDSSTLSSAATTIQAHVRGFLARNRLHSNKTTSLSSLVNSDGLSSSQDADNEQQKSKTVLNIHIVPEGGHFMSRDESMAMSVDLPFDTSPPSSLSNLHPLSFDVSERRKLLKREDAIQSVSPPSNNSAKLSEESVKEVIAENDGASTHRTTDDDIKTDISLQMEQENADLTSGDTSPTKSVTVETVLEMAQEAGETKPCTPTPDENKPKFEPSADEMDVVTPFVHSDEKAKFGTPRLLHSGEFHDVVLPTCVSRTETAVVREFKNVLGYFLLWSSTS